MLQHSKVKTKEIPEKKMEYEPAKVYIYNVYNIYKQN